MTFFGDTMRHKRKMKLEPQKVTAHNLGLSVIHYCRLEKGRRKPSLDVVRSCKNKYDLTDDEIEKIVSEMLP